ncbi:chemotaxis-specific protein-glutamate methyltransferase CheB [Desulfobotulus sp.]|jgi:two-component system chemotaxis response regulator CheB|uniref:chemotaxis-specific protein-glutamate methyltransferase CheB n=1 Tax=Desulfobotulus sp. TaxID=1940337 RepID=UPI002A359074|nr:chemotaxis-specific protein-glutamate methyltransferase CheB [Desulfobotulus sp.]MDY0161663.1 chemotaxis-specific protein-glutamate methyltransferase CheB [Desulfobotulus sp.]
MPAPITVLIVDDSRIFRNALALSLGEEADIQVLGSVRNGKKALEFLKNQHVDVITLDLDMPEMDGMETLKAIRRLNEENRQAPPMGVLVISGHAGSAEDLRRESLAAGAFAYVPKPIALAGELPLERLRNAVAPRIRSWPRQRCLTPGPPALSPASPPPCAAHADRMDVILIGVSTGGPKALHRLIPELCRFCDLPILVVQHMPPEFTQSLAESLSTQCTHTVVEAEEGMDITPKTVYIAPGGRHMLVRKHASRIRIQLSDGPPEKGCRPSVDILFRSAAPVWENRILALILTGMGRDGTQGAATLKRAGATIFVQDEASSVVWGMPGSVVAAGLSDAIFSLDAMAGAVRQFLSSCVGG